MQDQNKGILLVILATFLFASQDAMTKQLGASVPLSVFILFRYIAFCGFAYWWATRSKPISDVLKVDNVPLQITRGLLLVVEVFLFAYILKNIGLGEVHTIMVTFPLIITAFSPWILGESVGWRRWLAVFVGFVGTVIIISPGSVAFNRYSLMALACAVMFAFYNLLTRKASRTDSSESTLLYTGLVGLVVSLPLAVIHWQPVPFVAMKWIVALCLCSIFSHLCNILALKKTPAVTLQPFNYLVLPWAIGLGYVFFAERIPAHQYFGAALIGVSGLYVAYRQRVLSKEAHNQ